MHYNEALGRDVARFQALRRSLSDDAGSRQHQHGALGNGEIGVRRVPTGPGRLELSENTVDLDVLLPPRPDTGEFFFSLFL